jgi:hypothetical protein
MKLFNSRSEPWFKAWLVLVPIVGFGSYYLARNVWRRTQAMLQRLDQNIWEAPPTPDIPEPYSLVAYGLASGVLFTLFWLLISKVYIASQDNAKNNLE